MLTYSTIAAGEPASATAMTDHLLTRTLPREVADLARYYTGGRDAAASAEDRTVAELAGEMDKGNLSYSEAISELMLRHADRGADPDDEEARLGERLAQTLERRDFEAAYGPPVAEPRRDMHPLVARGLGLDPDRGVTRDEINALLAGRRADGARIEGKRYAVARQVTDRRTGEVKDLTPIGSVDFCLTPDKSVSVAWAFARPAEQASIYAAHRDAAAEAMAAIEGRIGQARKGDGGRDGADPGHVAWIAFDHYTSRPTLWTARQEDGRTVTESVSVQVPGDPDLHTHFTVPNAVFCENGRVGSLDLDRLDGLIKEAGALYQAHLAANLRRLGAEVVLDDRTGMARLAAIPDHVRDHFSKRTLGGEEAARAYARTLGLDWDALPPERRSGLLKAGVQGTPAGIDAEAREKLRKDDMADFADWRRQARELGWRYDGIEGPQRAGPGPTREERIARAYEVALPWLEKELDRRAVVTGADARTAALRGLIAAGIEETADVGRVTALFRSEGVRQYGEATALVWGRAGERGEVGITTALHAADEAEFMRLARAAAADRTGALRAGEIAAAAGRIGLAFEGDVLVGEGHPSERAPRPAARAPAQLRVARVPAPEDELVDDLLHDLRRQAEKLASALCQVAKLLLGRPDWAAVRGPCADLVDVVPDGVDCLAESSQALAARRVLDAEAEGFQNRLVYSGVHAFVIGRENGLVRRNPHRPSGRVEPSRAPRVHHETARQGAGAGPSEAAGCDLRRGARGLRG